MLKQRRGQLQTGSEGELEVSGCLPQTRLTRCTLCALQMSLPAEKVAELRQAIHTQLSEMGIQEQIQRCLADPNHQYVWHAALFIVSSPSSRSQ